MFKPGDKVRCIDPDRSLIMNKIYTVKGVNPTYQHEIILTELETHGSWFSSRFKLVRESDIPFGYKKGLTYV